MSKQQATLPPQLERLCLKNLKDGEVVYCSPWTMYADDDSSLWLNGESEYSTESGGSNSMKVSKVGEEFHVDVSNCAHARWDRGGDHNIEGGITPIPVYDLKGA